MANQKAGLFTEDVNSIVLTEEESMVRYEAKHVR